MIGGAASPFTTLVRRAWPARLIQDARKYPVLPILILAIVVVAGITAPWISPYDPERADLRIRMRPPAWVEGGSGGHLLGTDHIGRDMLTRTIHGARISLILALVTLGIGGAVGIAVGLLAGWYGRWVDEVIMRFADVMLALPLILVALVFVVTVGQSFSVIVAVLALWIWPRFARMVRAESLKLRGMEYVSSALVSGASGPRIMAKHLFPGVMNTVIVLATLQVGIVIVLESILSFLGAGVPPPTPAWGSMVADGRDRIATAWWISTIPGLAITLTVLALNLFGDWLRDAFDPTLRQAD